MFFLQFSPDIRRFSDGHDYSIFVVPKTVKMGYASIKMNEFNKDYNTFLLNIETSSFRTFMNWRIWFSSTSQWTTLRNAQIKQIVYLTNCVINKLYKCTSNRFILIRWFSAKYTVWVLWYIYLWFFPYFYLFRERK